MLASAGEAASILNNEFKKLKIRELLEGIAEESPFLWGLISKDLPRLLALLHESPEQHFSKLIENAATAARAATDDDEIMRILRKMKREAAL
ncbi:MAG TPA: hypothetical protein VHD34_03270, partial [Xanthobacteraceae bacterium]|nr:hypothetical protein [Xanthobacteraceae bacterium]